MTFGLLAWKAFLLLLIIAVGFMCKRMNIINEPTIQGLTNFLMKVAIPCLLIASVGTAPIAGGSSALIYCALVFTIYYIVLLPILRILFQVRRVSQAKTAVATCNIAFPNIQFFGLPLLSAVLGPQGVAYGAVMSAVFAVFFFTYGMSLFNQSLDRKSLFTPVNIATVIMMVLFAANVQLPEKLYIVLIQFGQLTTPLALIIIGGNMARSDLKTALKDKQLYAVSFVRLLLIPVLLIACTWPLEISYTLRMALLTGIACPAAALTAVAAKQTNMEAEFASQSIAHSTIFAVLTMPVLILALQSLLG